MFAGNLGGSGNSDGVGPDARFLGPIATAIDTDGNLYVADSVNFTIRKITPTGVVTTLAGRAGERGSADGTGTEARFFNPTGVAVDTAGNVYVADRGNRAIRKITQTGVVTTLAGPEASYFEPTGVSTDAFGNVYVADSSDHTIRRIPPAGVVTTLAGTAGLSGSADGIGEAASFFSPQGVAADSAGNVYVTDTGNRTLRRISPAGLVTTVAGVPGRRGFTPGALPGVLSSPRGVAVHGTTVYVTLYNGVAVVTNTP